MLLKLKHTNATRSPSLFGMTIVLLDLSLTDANRTKLTLYSICLADNWKPLFESLNPWLKCSWSRLPLKLTLMKPWGFSRFPPWKQQMEEILQVWHLTRYRLIRIILFYNWYRTCRSWRLHFWEGSRAPHPHWASTETAFRHRISSIRTHHHYRLHSSGIWMTCNSDWRSYCNYLNLGSWYLLFFISEIPWTPSTKGHPDHDSSWRATAPTSTQDAVPLEVGQLILRQNFRTIF